MGIYYRSGLVEGEHVDLPLIHKWEALKWMLCEKGGVDVRDERISKK
jgi:hypothetical protein